MDQLNVENMAADENNQQKSDTIQYLKQQVSELEEENKVLEQ
jgi:hypothetical protein